MTMIYKDGQIRNAPVVKWQANSTDYLSENSHE